MTSLSKLRAAVLMALHGSPACFVVSSPFTFTSPSCSGPLSLEGQRMDAIMWRLVISCAVCNLVLLAPRVHILHEVCSRHCFGLVPGGQSCIPRLNHADTDQLVCVSGGAIFALPCPYAAQQQARPAPWSPLANLHREALLQGLV